MGTVSVGSIASGASSADGFPKSNDVQWQQHQAQEKDGRQPLNHTVGDEADVAEDGDGAQQAYVLGRSTEPTLRQRNRLYQNGYPWACSLSNEQNPSDHAGDWPLQPRK